MKAALLHIPNDLHKILTATSLSPFLKNVYQAKQRAPKRDPMKNIVVWY